MGQISMFDLPNIYKIEGRIPQKIRVRTIEEFTIYQNDNDKTVLVEVQENEEFIKINKTYNSIINLLTNTIMKNYIYQMPKDD